MNLEARNAMPKEIIRDMRLYTATHLALNKNLMSDIANVRKVHYSL